VRVGNVLEVSSPRGSFVLRSGEGPVMLLSAGIGATPVLAMLNALSSAHSTRPVLWLHVARDGKHFPFAAEVRRLVSNLSRARFYVCFSRPEAADRLGTDFDAAGHLSRAMFEEAGLTPDADVYLCGPTRFMADMRAALTAFGVQPDSVHLEIFNGGESSTPGVTGAVTKTPHRPPLDIETGPLVSFARSGITAHWNPAVYQSMLELAEACDVPVRWACRTGVCHNCESGLVSGTVTYEPQPLDPPATGNLLICCSRPVGDVVLDL
jgi:ferredoxin-NADP reductase